MTDDYIRGNPDAITALVEYGDYHSRECAAANRVIDIVMDEFPDSIRFVFRNLPRDRRSETLAPAEAAESVGCHAGNAAFWRLHAIVFENQDALEIDDLLGYAEAAGGDPRKVAEDLASGAMRTRVLRHVDDAARAGITDVPAFFLNGRRFSALWTDVDAFVAALRRGNPIPS